MKIIIFSILLMISNTLMAESSLQSTTSKAVIESFNLEEQMITLHGENYIFAKKMSILDKNNSQVGFEGLKSGQVIEFDSSESSREAVRHDIQNHKTITYIKIISDNRKDDEVH